MNNSQLFGLCQRASKRLTERLIPMKEKVTGNEQKYTYHAGYDVGYLEGYISALEKIMDEIEITF